MQATESLSLNEALLADRERVLEQIYARTFPMVRHYIREHGGTSEDAKDIFQEAMILFYEKTVQGELNLTSAVSTYLMGICKNRWRQELDRRARQLPDTGNELADDLSEPENEQSSLKLLAFVEQLGATCQSILINFYYFGQRLEQIAQSHGYQTVRSATVQKFKCLERLRKSLSHLTVGHFKA